MTDQGRRTGRAGASAGGGGPAQEGHPYDEHRYDEHRYDEHGYDGHHDGHGYDEPDYDEHHDGHGYDEHGYDEHHDEPGYDEEAEWPVVPDRPGPRGSRPHGPRARRRAGRRAGLRAHPVLLALAVVVVVLILLVGGGILWAQSQIDPGGKRGPDVTVVIPGGASTRAIGSILASAGVIHDGTLFAYYVHFHGDGPLLPGTYSLPKNSPYSSIIADLEKGPVVLTEDLVIPEGFTVRQIAERVAALPHLGLSADKFLAAADSGAVRSPYEPAGVNNLEGLLFPATYQVRKGETEVQILEEMVGQFDTEAATIGLDPAARKLGVTPYQVVEVASIVEREAKLKGDRGPVASVIYNRLARHMPLGADSTQTYWLRLQDPTLGVPTAAQDDQPSPYNTRLNPGLPPTPISDPGLASLQAAIAPPATTYLYFVEVNADGQLGFASTQSGFASLQQQCQAAHLC